MPEQRPEEAQVRASLEAQGGPDLMLPGNRFRLKAQHKLQNTWDGRRLTLQKCLTTAKQAKQEDYPATHEKHLSTEWTWCSVEWNGVAWTSVTGLQSTRD